MRDVPNGWLVRYIHANGASMFFIVVYAHISRGLYYGSYMEPRELLWCSGVILLLLMMGTAFTGYVLPWGQMCENSCYNKIGKRCYSDIKCQGAHETSVRGLKHCEFYTPLELIRKNPSETSLPGRREQINNAFLLFADEVSNASFGMKAHLYVKTSAFSFFSRLGTISNGYVLLNSRFSRQEGRTCYCQRIHGRIFCTSKISTNSSFDSFRTEDTIAVKKEGGNSNLTKSSSMSSLTVTCMSFLPRESAV